MSNGNSHVSMKELLSDRERLRSVLENARSAAIRLHRAYNVPMVVSRNGKVVEISPFDVQTEEEKALAENSPHE